MDRTDYRIIDQLQFGFPVSEYPYAEMATQFGISEQQLIDRLDRLLADKVLTRFGPMYHAENLGGAITLSAMKVAHDDLERVAEIVNSFSEVAHNYEREHSFNLWFVVTAEDRSTIDHVLAAIEQRSGYRVYDFPKQEEFFVGLYFASQIK
jgi:siroheme decarboxylase